MKRIIISAIGGIGQDAKDAISILGSILKTERENIEDRRNIFYNPTIFKKITSPIINRLKEPLSKKALIRVETARALGRIGMNSEEAVINLEYALIDPKAIVRKESALSLGKLGSSASIAVPSLIKALKDKNPDVRWRASEALGLIRISTEEVISGLNSLIHDKCDYVCEAAINSIDDLTEE